MITQDKAFAGISKIDAEQQIGAKLIKEEIITEQQLEEALLKQKSDGGRVGDNLISLGYLTPEQFDDFLHKKPSIPKTIEDTGLELSFLADLAIKYILFMGEFKLSDISEKMRLPIQIVDKVVETLQKEKLVEVKGAPEYTRFSYRFAITGAGLTRAKELLDMCSYIGPAPVSLDSYRKMVHNQTIKNVSVHQEELSKAFSHLVINPRLIKQLGPALT